MASPDGPQGRHPALVSSASYYAEHRKKNEGSSGERNLGGRRAGAPTIESAEWRRPNRLVAILILRRGAAGSRNRSGKSCPAGEQASRGSMCGRKTCPRDRKWFRTNR